MKTQLIAWLLIVFISSVHLVAEEARTVRPAEASVDRTYRLAPKDMIEVKVYRQPDLDTRARVAENGTVTMPLLGGVKVGGQTAAEAGGAIRQLLAADYLVDPQVSVAVVEYARRAFTVMGQVQTPGTYEMPPDEQVNVLQAIAMAGGYTRLSAPGKVIVQRMDKGQKRIFRLDAASMAKDDRVTPFEILPGDTITVGERLW
jgi:polysaccharide export outer membrane protein